MTIRTFAGIGSEVAPPPTGDIYSDQLVPGGADENLKGRVAVPFATETSFTWVYDPVAGPDEAWEIEVAGGGLHSQADGGVVNAHAPDLGQQDIWVEAQFATVGPLGSFMGPCIGLNPGVNTGGWYVSFINATRYRLYRAIDDVNLGNIDGSWSAGAKIRIERVGNQLTVFVDPDGLSGFAQELSVEDIPIGWTPGTYAGFWKNRLRNVFMQGFRCGPMP